MRRGRRGCLDALLVDALVIKEAQMDEGDLSMAPAFDLVPHKWLYQAIGAPVAVSRLIRKLIPLWATDLTVQTSHGTEKIPVQLKRGIFQGDSHHSSSASVWHPSHTA